MAEAIVTRAVGSNQNLGASHSLLQELGHQPAGPPKLMLIITMERIAPNMRINVCATSVQITARKPPMEV